MDFASESLQPMGLTPSSELTVNRLVLTASSVPAGQGEVLVLASRADQRGPAERHALGLVRSSSSWMLCLQLKGSGFGNTGNEAGCTEWSGLLLDKRWISANGSFVTLGSEIRK